MSYRLSITLSFLLIALLFGSGAASADAVDGDWCFKDGRSLSIDGPNMVTPGGKHQTGEYDRHVFRYTIPDGEAGAGKHVLMVQWSEQEIRVWYGTTKPVTRAGEPEIWRRCHLRTS